MIGKYRIIGGQGYLVTNKGGTLRKLWRIPWYKQLYWAVVSYFRDVEVIEESKHCKGFRYARIPELRIVRKVAK